VVLKGGRKGGGEGGIMSGQCRTVSVYSGGGKDERGKERRKPVKEGRAKREEGEGGRKEGREGGREGGRGT
jgi:hypothetical protein